MDNVISFTPNQLVGFITTICACCAGVATLVGIIIKIVMRMKKPEIEQNERLTACENRLTAIEQQNKIFTQYFINDNNRFNAIENSTKAILGTLRALLKHAINGNDKEQLIKADSNLDDFLINSNYKPRTDEQHNV